MTSFGTAGLIKLCQANHNLVLLETKHTDQGKRTPHHPRNEMGLIGGNYSWRHGGNPLVFEGVSLSQGNSRSGGCSRAQVRSVGVPAFHRAVVWALENADFLTL